MTPTCVGAATQGREPGSVRLIEIEEESSGEVRGGRGGEEIDEWMRMAGGGREARQRSLPGCNCEHSDDETGEFASGATSARAG